ncbi:MAG: hypothetical protein Kow0025_17850 [Thermodesulfovibrionales bacterium]
MREEVNEAFQSVVGFVREVHAEEIDGAYEYFWEEDYPEDFLMGAALDLAFINFEDWLVCDYRRPDGSSYIDLYLEKNEASAAQKTIMEAMKGSLISLYEVARTGGETVVLRDLLLDREAVLSGEVPGELKLGDLFAARLLEIDGQRVMAPCVYPYGRGHRDAVLDFIDKQFSRYVKNKNPEGTMAQYLKDESYIFNTIWITSIFKLK